MNRRVLSQALLAIVGLAALASVAHFLAGMWEFTWLKDLKRTRGMDLEGWTGDIWQRLVIVAVAFIVAYALTLDRAAPRRPVGMILAGAFGTGALAGLWFRCFATVYKLTVEDAHVDGLMWAMVLGGGAAMSGLVLGFEAAVRAGAVAVCRYADDRGQESLAIAASRVALLFRPGQRSMLLTVALADFRAGDRDETTDILTRLYEEGRREPELLEALCQHAFESKQPEKYLEYLRTFQRLLPDDPVLRKGLFEELGNQGRPDEALDFALRNGGFPDDDEAQESFATLLAGNARYEEAVSVARSLGLREGIPFRRSQKILRDILTRASEYVPALNLLAEQSERMAMREQRLRWLEKSFEADPRQTGVRDVLRSLYRETGQTQKLLRLLERAVEENPAEGDAWVEMIELLDRTGRLEEATTQVVEYHQVHRASARSRLLEAKIRLDLRQLEEAAEAVKAAREADDAGGRGAEIDALARRIERAQLTAELSDKITAAHEHPGDLALQVDVIERLVAGGHAEKGLGFIDELLRLNPGARAAVIHLLAKCAENPDTPFPFLDLLVDLQVNAGEFEPALRTIQLMARRALNPLQTLREASARILRRDPHHIPTLRLLGDRYFAAGMFTETIHEYSLYLANGGENTREVARALATSYLAIGNYENARKHVATVIAEGELGDLSLLRQMVALALEVGEPEEAAEFLKGIERLDPASTETRELKAGVDRGLGNKRFAFLQRELDSGRGGAEMLERLGDMARELDNLTDAITYYQRASREPSLARRAKVKLAWVFARKKLYDISSETLAEVTLSINDDPADMSLLMDLIYEIADMYQTAALHDRAHRLFKLLLKIDAAYRDVLKRVETLS